VRRRSRRAVRRRGAFYWRTRSAQPRAHAPDQRLAPSPVAALLVRAAAPVTGSQSAHRYRLPRLAPVERRAHPTRIASPSGFMRIDGSVRARTDRPRMLGTQPRPRPRRRPDLEWPALSLSLPHPDDARARSPCGTAGSEAEGEGFEPSVDRRPKTVLETVLPRGRSANDPCALGQSRLSSTSRSLVRAACSRVQP
jgi:hypothetical protein